jgi:hypothetical protein
MPQYLVSRVVIVHLQAKTYIDKPKEAVTSPISKVPITSPTAGEYIDDPTYTANE